MLKFFSLALNKSREDSFTPPTYLPVRLLWSHGVGAVCERIPAGVYRLLDFGKIRLSGGPELTFDTEIPRVNERLVLSAGCYILEIIVAADRITKRYRVRARIQDKPGRILPELQDLLGLKLL